MKKWQLGICVTCACVLAGMFLFTNSAQAAGRADGAAQASAVPAAQCVPRETALDALLAPIKAETRARGARLVRDAAAALQHGVPVIELPGFSAPRASAPPALASTTEQ